MILQHRLIIIIPSVDKIHTFVDDALVLEEAIHVSSFSLFIYLFFSFSINAIIQSVGVKKDKGEEVYIYSLYVLLLVHLD